MSIHSVAAVGEPPEPYEQILYAVEDPVATITLHRPERRNAWTGRMAAEVRHAFARAEADPQVVVIVLTGAGKGFCVGADVAELDPPTSPDPSDVGREWGLEVSPGMDDMESGFRGHYSFLMSLRKPVIAAVNGACAGMGLALALGADLRFASEKAIFTTRYAPMGIVAEWGTSWMLPRIVGQARAMDLLLSSRVVDAKEAEQMGLVNRTVAPDALMSATLDYAREMGRTCSPTALARIKRQVYEDTMRSYGDAAQTSFELMATCFEEPDLQEGVKSFQEKRPPAFRRIGAD